MLDRGYVLPGVSPLRTCVVSEKLVPTRFNPTLWPSLRPFPRSTIQGSRNCPRRTSTRRKHWSPPPTGTPMTRRGRTRGTVGPPTYPLARAPQRLTPRVQLPPLPGPPPPCCATSPVATAAAAASTPVPRRPLGCPCRSGHPTRCCAARRRAARRPRRPQAVAAAPTTPPGMTCSSTTHR